MLINYSSTGRDSHITQIAAVGQDKSFNCHVLPKKPIQNKASEITGLKLQQGKLFHNGVEVHAVSIREALELFSRFLGNKPFILIGHNIKVFDCHVLVNAAVSCNMMNCIKTSIAGFVDTLTIFKNTYKDLSSYKQESLYYEFVEDKYQAHNALDDVKALKILIDKVCFSAQTMQRHSYKLSYTIDTGKYCKQRDKLLLSWQPLVEKKLISTGMAAKASGSGLSLTHLHLAYRRSGIDGIFSLFGERAANGKPRVTKKQQIVEKVASFFKE